MTTLATRIDRDKVAAAIRTAAPAGNVPGYPRLTASAAVLLFALDELCPGEPLSALAAELAFELGSRHSSPAARRQILDALTAAGVPISTWSNTVDQSTGGTSRAAARL